MTEEPSIKPSRKPHGWRIHLSWAAFVATALGAYGAAHVVDAVKKNHDTGYQFGPQAGLTGAFNRQVHYTTCADCETLRDILVHPENELQKTMSSALFLLTKSALGQLLVGFADKKDIYFNGGSTLLEQTCSISAMFEGRTGSVSYRADEFAATEGKNVVGMTVHELYHAFQYGHPAINALLYSPHFSLKEKVMIDLVKEAAGFAAATLTVHQLQRQGLDVVPDATVYGLPQFGHDYDAARARGMTENEAEIVAAQGMITRFLTGDANRNLRQRYIFKRNPGNKDFMQEPEHLSVAALSALTMLPDGRTMMPKDMTLAKIDLAIRKDMYDEFSQWRPLGIEKEGTKERVRVSKSARKETEEMVCYNRQMRAAKPKKSG